MLKCIYLTIRFVTIVFILSIVMTKRNPRSLESPLMKRQHSPIKIIVVSGCQEKSLLIIASESIILK